MNSKSKLVFTDNDGRHVRHVLAESEPHINTINGINFKHAKKWSFNHNFFPVVSHIDGETLIIKFYHCEKLRDEARMLTDFVNAYCFNVLNPREIPEINFIKMVYKKQPSLDLISSCTTIQELEKIHLVSMDEFYTTKFLSSEKGEFTGMGRTLEEFNRWEQMLDDGFLEYSEVDHIIAAVNEGIIDKTLNVDVRFIKRKN
tara:strand:+ start:243 stop:845 length:603 start_codon:yes stop_codon:yes gene_type:complete